MNTPLWVKTWWARWLHLVGAAHRHYGITHGDIGEYEMAVHYFTRAVEFDPTFARAYLDRGILYWRELDHPRRAILDLTQALEIDPALDEAIFNRGIARQQLREYKEALADFTAYLSVGRHPHWREHAGRMIEELAEWITQEEGER